MVSILTTKYFHFAFLSITYEESVFYLHKHWDTRSSVLAEISGEKCNKTKTQSLNVQVDFERFLKVMKYSNERG